VGAPAVSAPPDEVKRGPPDDEEALSDSQLRFLDALIFGLAPGSGARKPKARRSASSALQGVLGLLDVHSLARCARLCRRAGELVSVEWVWEPRVQHICAMWALGCARAGTWRKTFFEVLRPRCDGIYVGECRYVHRICPGSSLEPRSKNRGYHWVDYRRYVRLFPPTARDAPMYALVLRDHCGFEAAAEVLSTICPVEQLQASCSSQVSHDGGRNIVTRPLSKRVAAGTYTWSGSRVEIHVPGGVESYFMALELSHGGDATFCGCLRWLEYYMQADSGDVTQFNLGRNRYGDGGPLDCERDHYAPMYIRSWPSLQHLL